MQYSHQAQLSEIIQLPARGDEPAVFWSANVRHVITAHDDSGWSLRESTGAPVGEFLTKDGWFAILDDDGGDGERFDNWRSAVRHILRRGLRAA